MSTAPLALVWHSSFAALTGYSGSSVAFTLGLDAHDVAVRPLFLYGADHDEQVMAGGLHPRVRALQHAPLRLDVPQVVYAPADRFSKNSGSYRIGFTMLEVDRLPPNWVAQANQMDELWTPTAWGAATFAASGVTRPVHVVPLGVDPARFAPMPPRQALTDRTVFLAVFEWGERKGWDILLRAYRRAFRADDPVLLVLKVDCRVATASPAQQLATAAPAGGPPVALIYNQPLGGVQLRELYNSADCFVLPTRGEGWGMPCLEAMACGVPAIATDWSGSTAFVNAANGYPLPIRGLVPANQEHPYYRHAQWADPDEEALVALLQRVVNDPAERRRKAAQALADVQQWTWQRGLDVMLTRLRAVS